MALLHSTSACVAGMQVWTATTDNCRVSTDMQVTSSFSRRGAGKQPGLVVVDISHAANTYKESCSVRSRCPRFRTYSNISPSISRFVHCLSSCNEDECARNSFSRVMSPFQTSSMPSPFLVKLSMCLQPMEIRHSLPRNTWVSALRSRPNPTLTLRGRVRVRPQGHNNPGARDSASSLTALRSTSSL
jgi:hypothetical protein